MRVKAVFADRVRRRVVAGLLGCLLPVLAAGPGGPDRVRV